MSKPGMRRPVVMGILLLAAAGNDGVAASPASFVASFAAVNHAVQQRMVKLYGTGGLQQLEAYQTGLMVSPEGHIATVSSVVLDRGYVTAILGDGRRYTAEVVGSDRVAELAVLKIDTLGEPVPYFDLSPSVPNTEVSEGMRLLAFSNLYNVATGDEPMSVLRGTLAAVAPLRARRGAFATPFRGPVYVLDAPTNNPGAAGGVVVDLAGRPLGMVGKEVRSQLTGTWLNYAVPWPEVARRVERILSSDTNRPLTEETWLPERPVTFAALGLRLVPNIVSRTPPYLDAVLPNSPAARAGLRPDDLVVAIGGIVTGSRQEVERALAEQSIDQPLSVTLLREEQLIDVQLIPEPSR